MNCIPKKPHVRMANLFNRVAGEGVNRLLVVTEKEWCGQSSLTRILAGGFAMETLNQQSLSRKFE